MDAAEGCILIKRFGRVRAEPEVTDGAVVRMQVASR